MPVNKPSDAVSGGEDAIVRRFFAPLAQGYPGALGLVDDCAVVTPPPGTELVLKTDPVAEGVHFLPGDAPADIAWKALAVNVSDLAAKGADPLGYLMALSFPDAPGETWLADFAAGLKQAQTAFGCHLLGGDTDRRPGPITVSITALGIVPKGRMVRRATANPAAYIFVSGTLGDSALGLALRKTPALATTWGLASDEAGALRGRYLRPQPRLPLATALRECASAAMDISDGLAKDLTRMCRASGCGALVTLADVPLSAGARKALACDPGLIQSIVAGGDDYEVLAAVQPDLSAQFSALAAAAGVPVTQIGTMTPGPAAEVSLVGPGGQPLRLQVTGWEHF